MSPQSVAPQSSPAEIYQWFHLSDFTPGIYANSHISTADPNSSAPPGSAHPDGTWGCAAIAGGGLGPLPGFTATPFVDGSFPGATTDLLVSGFINNPGFTGTGGNELVRIYEGDDGTDHYLIAEAIDPATPSSNQILGVSAATQAGFFGSPYPVFTRMSSDGTGNPPPVLVFPAAVINDPNGVSGHVYVYPPIATPTSYACQDLNNPIVIVTGQIIAYGQRLTILSGMSYPHPGADINTNENIDYTDPPLSAELVDALEILGAEWPWGYGAWGSVSVGELLLIKKVGGALIVNGDITGPTSVIEIPGVQPTGDLVGQAAATPSGLYYCAQNLGAWIWNGGNNSTKVSMKLADDFFAVAINEATNNYGFNCYQWQKYVLFSHNYIYDTETGAWWILSPQLQQSAFGTGIELVDIWWYTAAAFGNQLFASPLQVRKGHNDPYYMEFDNTKPTTAWAWQSVPIFVETDHDRVIDVRQVFVTLSQPDGDPNSSIQVLVNGTSLGTVGAITSEPTSIRFDSGVRGVENIELQLVASNSNSHSAPILHSVDVGYASRAKIPASN